MSTRAGWRWRWAARSITASGAGIHTPHRRALAAELSGTVLEIGPGAGANFGHLPGGVRWIGLEPNRYLHPSLRLAAAGRGPVLGGEVERIPLADASVDAVLGTIVLCSVDDQRQALAEIVRVLRPGGRYFFLEHVAADPGSWSRLAQGAFTPVSKWLDGGCHPARETGRMIEAAGFGRVEIERFVVRGPFGVGLPHLVGRARTARTTLPGPGDASPELLGEGDPSRTSPPV